MSDPFLPESARPMAALPDHVRVGIGVVSASYALDLLLLDSHQAIWQEHRDIFRRLVAHGLQLVECVRTRFRNDVPDFPAMRADLEVVTRQSMRGADHRAPRHRALSSIRSAIRLTELFYLTRMGVQGVDGRDLDAESAMCARDCFESAIAASGLDPNGVRGNVRQDALRGAFEMLQRFNGATVVSEGVSQDKVLDVRLNYAEELLNEQLTKLAPPRADPRVPDERLGDHDAPSYVAPVSDVDDLDVQPRSQAARAQDERCFEIRLELPWDATDDQVKRAVERVVRAADFAHRAEGGSGLVVDVVGVSAVPAEVQS